MSHDDAVGWHDRPAENGDAEIEYPARCLLWYERHDNKEGHGGSDRRPGLIVATRGVPVLVGVLYFIEAPEINL
jgi:hypothetical protein